ncbi:hypothetical protein NXY55_08955 [Aeromonas veronii]|nr:hypothetical protein [Aeromonas veronii]
MVIAIFTTLASLASLLGLAFQLYQHKERLRTYVFLGISFFCAVISAVLWVEVNQLEKENEVLLNARIEADKLLSSWPDVGRFDFTSDGEFRGIVISGMAFLEANKAIFPDTYSTAKTVLFIELEAASNKDDNYISKRSKLQEAAETMVTTIRGIRLSGADINKHDG